MKAIQMVDTFNQYLKIKSEVDTAIQKVLDSAAYINGPVVKEFAKNLADYLNVKHVIPCANGTDALQIALMALGLEPGDEVITPSFTFIATTEVVALLRLKPVFVDVDKDSFCMNIEQLKAAITSKTKAIVPVHLYGQSANMEEIMKIAAEHHLYVIEDNAQAIGGTFTYSNGEKKKTGTIGHIGCTSFYPSKNLGAYGDGGAIFTNDDALAEQMNMIANHGSKIRYQHEVVGCNSRLDSIQAAILNIKLSHLDAYNEARQKVAAYYNHAFANHPKITTPFVATYTNHVYHQYTLVLHDVNRDAVKEYLHSKGVPSMLYYPQPVHKQDVFKGLNTDEEKMAHTNWLTERVISLPIHTEMDEEQLKFITETFLEAVNL
ncbi:MAG: DegT/DnrJ/EryC1/StrS family aminotransferase [Chitinophagaceae bacterium]|nr:MAG: DegT/DnrJ/EryC1/StrS family aminotransferase [Chitinophagaceae bacterium]